MEFTEDQVGEDTEVVGDGEYIQYAEADFGPFTVEFERAHQNTFSPNEAQFVLKGPIVDQMVVQYTETMKNYIIKEIGSWDYIERCENEVFRV